ncbi:MAG TPA: hypothetical protein VH044_07545 [Polyangiaceae bacterium]|jgi:hypothetical protein|nr:hypothetical protein [Polyangiaceae bacterium]
MRDAAPAVHVEDKADGKPASTPLVATLPRWAASSAGLLGAIGVALALSLGFLHASPAWASLLRLAALLALPAPLLAYALLRGEESRLARDLRTARTGTPVLRALLLRRRQELPILTRWSATKLGRAALLLADGDREGAVAALATSSKFVRGGRVERLRAVVTADLERNGGTAPGLERCVRDLRAEPPLGNREADLYRVHVLVKAILERGDDDAGAELASAYAVSADDEERVYATWLRVWFELDAFELDASELAESATADALAGDRAFVPLPTLAEGDLRMAMLAARAHGAEGLIEKLEQRLATMGPAPTGSPAGRSAIAHPDGQG